MSSRLTVIARSIFDRGILIALADAEPHKPLSVSFLESGNCDVVWPPTQPAGTTVAEARCAVHVSLPNRNASLLSLEQRAWQWPVATGPRLVEGSVALHGCRRLEKTDHVPDFVETKLEISVER